MIIKRPPTWKLGAPLTRRTVLRGLLGGAAVTIALPPLEALMGRGRAHAAEGFPKRFGIFYWGNGILPDRWNPIGQGSGDDWQLNTQMAPLANVKDHLTVVSGTKVKTGNPIAHTSGPGGFLTGHPLILRGGESHTYAAPSIDQVMAQSIGGDTRFRSLEVGVQPDARPISYNGPDSTNPPEVNPAAFFERLFGGGFRAPGEDSEPDPTLALRRSVLDSVIADGEALKKRLGATDKVRLDQHLDGIRDLEKRIARLAEDPPRLDACARPEMPTGDYPLVEGRPPMSEISRAMADLMVMALACDQTRVFTFAFSTPVNNTLYEGAEAGHHKLTHDEPGDQPQVDMILTQHIMPEFAYLLERLKAVDEGGDTLLDHSVVLGMTDCSFGRTHSIEDFPIVLAGSCSGALKTGLHYRSPTAENSVHVSLSLLRAMGVRAAEFGAEDGLVKDGLSAIEA
ncbi:MAG: DUF1552 domain-containing protein [Myxococcales bacterium]|nr:DUF1552 domain-containing protein [Myxococcales bacterium]